MDNTHKKSRDSQNKNLLKLISQENLFDTLKTLPLLAIIANIIIFSSALKLTGGDYYLASEAIKSIDLNSWWISNLSTIVLAIFFCASPLFYYPSQGISSRAIFYFKETFSITKIPPYTETITAQVLASFFILSTSAYINYILGFKSFIVPGLITSFAYLIISLIIIFAGIPSKGELQQYTKSISKKLPVIVSIILTFLSPVIVSDSAILGQSCLIQTSDEGSKPIADIIPLDFSKDSLKAIYLNDPGYIKHSTIDESFSIYPNSCDSIDFSP